MCYKASVGYWAALTILYSCITPGFATTICWCITHSLPNRQTPLTLVLITSLYIYSLVAYGLSPLLTWTHSSSFRLSDTIPPGLLHTGRLPGIIHALQDTLPDSSLHLLLDSLRPSIWSYLDYVILVKNFLSLADSYTHSLAYSPPPWLRTGIILLHFPYSIPPILPHSSRLTPNRILLQDTLPPGFTHYFTVSTPPLRCITPFQTH